MNIENLTNIEIPIYLKFTRICLDFSIYV
jgi:hypothetical protein